MTRFERIACGAARAAGLGLGALGLLYLRDAWRQTGAASLVLGLFLVAVAIGSWLRKPIALRAATWILVVAGFVLPLGLLNPFHAGDQGKLDGAFIARTVVLALGSSLVCLLLAYLVSQARLVVTRRAR